ncbi:MAG: hypothetical protein AAGF99_17520 [Bacteroidota bacterium]
MTEPEATALASKAQTCACGHRRDHPDVRALPRYGFGAMVLLMAGASATPKRIDYRCTRCSEVFDAATDPDERAHYR